MTTTPPDAASMTPLEISQASLEVEEDLSATEPPTPLAPGDEVAAGTPGSGESICRTCGGSGRAGSLGAQCPECLGTGKVTVGVGGA